MTPNAGCDNAPSTAGPSQATKTPSYRNPYLFIVGAARSGTTLVQRLLDAHPMLAVVNETYWVLRALWEPTGLTREGLVTRALIEQLMASPKFDRMGLSVDDLTRLMPSDVAITYDRYVSSLFDLYAARRGKPLAGDKSPGYVRRMAQLHELLPSARFVHIIRDPRDVCLSMLEWSSGENAAGQFGTWAEDPVTSTALYWRLSVGLGRQFGAQLGGEIYHEVRYENLVASPESTVTRLCTFLGIPYDPCMTRYHEGKTRTKPGKSSKGQWLPVTPGLRNWTNQLPAEAIERIETVTGDLMADVGYRCRTGEGAPRPIVSEHVARIKATFTAFAQRRARPLPQIW
jgi:hypothetical protein